MDAVRDEQDIASDRPSIDYYETLQVSPSAELETIHRVYRMLAMRFHPDNRETGNSTRFRELTEAYHVLSDPERRARYDVMYHQQRQDQWRLVTEGAAADHDFGMEHFVRIAVLDVLYTKRRLEPDKPGLFVMELEKLIGQPREHLEFTVWFLVQKKLVQRGDNSTLVITADGVEHLEQQYRTNGTSRRLRAVND